MSKVLDTQDLVRLYDDLHNQRNSEPASWLPPLALANAAGHQILEVSESVPTRAVWNVPDSIGSDAIVRDRLLLAATLSVWKIVRLLGSLRSSWMSGTPYFDSMTATVTLRSAMEEAARLAIAGKAVVSVAERTDGSLDAPAVGALAEELLKSGEVTGLEQTEFKELSLFKMVLEAAPEAPPGTFLGGRSRAKDVYGYLSTFVHPKGVSRKAFRNADFAGDGSAARIGDI